MDEQNTNEMSIRNMNIYEKMLAITAELQTVAKNIDLKAGGGSYKAVSERDIIDAVKPMEEKYRVYSYPSDRQILESSVLESESTYNGKTTTKNSFFTRIMTTYTFVNIDKPEEKLTMITFAEGIDPQDKGSGKAMTYSDKYALMKAYKISTGDDPDQNPSEPDGFKPKAEQPQRMPRQNNNTSAEKCGLCGKEVTDAITKDGTVMKKEDVIRWSKEKFGGAVFCADCQKEVMSRAKARRTGE